jgi:hypothetical protein
LVLITTRRVGGRRRQEQGNCHTRHREKS